MRSLSRRQMLEESMLATTALPAVIDYMQAGKLGEVKLARSIIYGCRGDRQLQAGGEPTIGRTIARSAAGRRTAGGYLARCLDGRRGDVEPA